jgi:hypothetical protein
MSMFQNSLGVWVLHDGTGYRYFQSEQEARVAMAALNVSEQPLEVEFVQTIVGEFLPNLRKLYLAMAAMQVQWQDEDFQAALAEAALSGETLAGFPATTWAAWGNALLALQGFLEAPQEALGGATMKTVLMRRYVAEVAA